MLRPSSRSVRLRVVADSVCGTLAKGWMRPAVLATAGHATGRIPAPTEGAENSAPVSSNPDHALAIEAVLLELEKALPLRGARLHVEIADSLVHLDVVSGEFSGESDRQLQSIADACVAELLGDAAPRHLVRWQLQAGGQHLLIGAIPRDLLATLSEAAVRHGLALCSVQPDFCLRWNWHADALKPGNSVFAVASGHDAVVALVSNGAVTTLSCGSWLDGADSSAVQSPHVTQLMCGLGLMSPSTARALDSRVDRLLASLGVAAEELSTLVLVGPEGSKEGVSSRWTVLEPTGTRRTDGSRLRLEFSPRAREFSKPGAAVLLVSMCALVAMTAQLSLKLADNARQTQRLTALEEQLGQSKAQGSRARPPDPGEVTRLRAARQVASQLTTPWAALLDSLESSPVKSVALLSIEPSVSKRSVRLTAEARNLADMLAYLSALQQDGRLSAAVLVSHQVQVQSPGSPVRFQIQAGWGGAAP